jgi:hypothetical protein
MAAAGRGANATTCLGGGRSPICSGGIRGLATALEARYVVRERNNHVKQHTILRWARRFVRVFICFLCTKSS